MDCPILLFCSRKSTTPRSQYDRAHIMCTDDCSNIRRYRLRRPLGWRGPHVSTGHGRSTKGGPGGTTQGGSPWRLIGKYLRFVRHFRVHLPTHEVLIIVSRKILLHPSLLKKANRLCVTAGPHICVDFRTIVRHIQYLRFKPGQIRRYCSYWTPWRTGMISRF